MSKKILIVSASPYTLTRLGRMNSYIMQYLSRRGYQVATACWDHDSSWYSSDEDGIYWYEVPLGKVGPLYMIPKEVEAASVQLYEIIKTIEADVVLSIGDIHDVEFIASLKLLDSQMFKWINILTSGTGCINENYEEVFDNMDLCIPANETTEVGLRDVYDIYSDPIYFGPDYRVFKDLGKEKSGEKFVVSNFSKNSHQSNLGAYLEAVRLLKGRLTEEEFNNVEFNLHTNFYENGDYDLDLLLDRYDIRDNIVIPEDFIGINDGIPDDKLNEVMSKTHVVVDSSCQSATGIATLEAMQSGAIPVVTYVGFYTTLSSHITIDSLYNYDENGMYRLNSNDLGRYTDSMFVTGTPFISHQENRFKIVDPDSLAASIANLYETWRYSPETFSNIQDLVKKTAKRYDLKNFLKSIEESIQNIHNKINTLDIETI